MNSIIAIAAYIIILIILINSKLKTEWIIWASFMSGYSICYFSDNIIKLLNN